MCWDNCLTSGSAHSASYTPSINSPILHAVCNYNPILFKLIQLEYHQWKQCAVHSFIVFVHLEFCVPAEPEVPFKITYFILHLMCEWLAASPGYMVGVFRVECTNKSWIDRSPLWIPSSPWWIHWSSNSGLTDWSYYLAFRSTIVQIKYT